VHADGEFHPVSAAKTGETCTVASSNITIKTMVENLEKCEEKEVVDMLYPLGARIINSPIVLK
jgi:hypothetical protein